MSDKYPDVVAQLSEKHAAWVKTLAPLREVSKVTVTGPGQRVTTGHGWEAAAKEGSTNRE